MQLGVLLLLRSDMLADRSHIQEINNLTESRHCTVYQALQISFISRDQVRC